MLAALLAAVVGYIPTSDNNVSVAYAASLVAPMQGPIAAALRARTGLNFLGEPKGSRALAHLIQAGLRTPDVFISAEPDLINAQIAPSETIFASARMVIAYSPKSPHAKLFEQAAAGQRSVLSALNAPGVLVGRTDPALDPKGARTLRALQLLGKKYRSPAVAQQILTRSQIFPEEDLAVRVESGELDAGFFYSTETNRAGMRTVELPGGTNLADQTLFAIAVLTHAPDPQAGHRFVTFLLGTDGKRILERYGLRFFSPPRYKRWVTKK